MTDRCSFRLKGGSPHNELFSRQNLYDTGDGRCRSLRRGAGELAEQPLECPPRLPELRAELGVLRPVDLPVQLDQAALDELAYERRVICREFDRHGALRASALWRVYRL